MNQASPRYEWNRVPWRRAEVSVFKLQKRIYRAQQRGDLKLMRKLQRLLLNSRSAKLLAVRRVTQDNRGKRTAGVDGVAKLNQKERLHLVETLNLKEKCKPVRRIWIPKAGRSEERPLGIPTMSDRAKQALVKMALEPEWEAKLEPNSYGFRPGRSCQDAIGAIYIALGGKSAFVLDADISSCFDKIDHQALLDKLSTTPTLRKVVKGWLKAGIMEGSVLHRGDSGVPQGGVISPLLANIALHGLEYETKQGLAHDLSQYRKKKHGHGGHAGSQAMMSVIRYADDFVVLHEDKEIVMKAKAYIEGWLKKIGLELKESKTRLCHSLNSLGDGKPGFDFLGFTVRQYPISQNKRGSKLLIKPSRQSQIRHDQIIKQTLRKMRGSPQEAVIHNLNPIVRGWSLYYRTKVSRQAFERLDDLMHYKLWRWAAYRHPDNGKRWIKRKYFRRQGKDRWRFMNHSGIFLPRHTDYPIKRHVKVAGTRSPYDGDWVYWCARLGRNPGIVPRVGMLLKVQQRRCAHCRLWFKAEDLMEVHHKDRTCSNNKAENLVLLHRHCHDDIHRVGAYGKR